MYKRIISINLILCFLLTTILITPNVASAQDTITVMINGQKILFDVQPQRINDRILVPMRTIFESLGATVEWYEDTQFIIAKKDNTIIGMQINNPVMDINNVPMQLDIPPQIIDGKTLVPVRAVAESFDADVAWNEDTQTISITADIKMATVYSDDGRIAIIPESQVQQWKNVGWLDYFPYANREFWMNQFYLFPKVTDINNNTVNYSDFSKIDFWSQIKIIWFDVYDLNVINQYERAIKYLVFDLNGGQYKMPLGDLLRGKKQYIPEFSNRDAFENYYQQIRWESPQKTFNITLNHWNMIKKGQIYIGMTKDEFILTRVFAPSKINKTTTKYGTSEQWVYSGYKYYYFTDDILSGWQE